MKTIGLRVVIGCVLASSVFVAYAQDRLFNDYILRAVEELATTRSGLGYKNKPPVSYTQDLTIDKYMLKAAAPPLTMCVASQIEVISVALKKYKQDYPSSNLYKFLPIEQWRAMRPDTLRGKIWMVEESGSSGTAYALEYFGMGEQIPFEDLKKGSFVNINREPDRAARRKASGHAAIFLSYLDNTGNDVEKYSSQVAGFKYFSAQGKESNGGFGYRYAFFEDAGCPILERNKKRDCHIIRSTNQKVLNSGVMLSPIFWQPVKRDRALAFSRAGQKGPEVKYDFDYYNGVTTDD